MLDALNILNGIFLGATMMANVTLYSDGDYQFHTKPEDRETVTVVSTHREWWREDGNGKCKYVGLMVPYVRDWPETIRHGEVEDVLPPEPDKTAGQAFVFNRKVCEGKPDEAIFRIASIRRTYGGYLSKHQVTAEDVNGMKPEDRPKWFDQVLLRIGRVAGHDAQAKEFLDFTASAVEKKAQSAKETPAPADATAATSTPAPAN